MSARAPSPRARRALALLLLLSLATARAGEPVRVFAAASLAPALTEIAGHWQRAGHPAPVLAFGGSAALAKQVAAGAPADLFASADRRWMDYLDERRRLVAGSRREWLTNTLVLIAPRGRGFALTLVPGVNLGAAFAGKLCTGEPAAVPAGAYAREALQALGAWGSVQARLVGTDDVRTALAFVERGECGAGIVYATDAAGSDRVQTVASFPAGTHAPIVYPFAQVVGGRPQARAFLDYLQQAPEAASVFARLGFRRLEGRPP